MSTGNRLPTLPLARLRALLTQFAECARRVEAAEEEQAADDHERIGGLLAGYAGSVERDRFQQEEIADDFNLLDVLRLTDKETRHSMMLAWLLDRDMRNLGTHAQGSLGFRLFLSEFHDLTPPVHVGYADSPYWVRREAIGDEAIVDIEIGCRGQFLIHIENKIWSREGSDQTDREWSDLQRRAVSLNVSEHHVHALFLTPHGAKPKNSHFQAIRWGRIVRVLEAFADQAKPADVKLFAGHYARALTRFIVVQDTSEGGNGEETHE